MKLFEIYENTGQWITHRQLAKIIYMRTGNMQLARDFDAIEDEFVSQDDMQSTGLSGFNVDPFEFDRDRVNKILGDHNTGVKVLKMKQDGSYNTLYQIMQMARINASVTEADVIDFDKATDPANTPIKLVNKLLQRIGISDYGVIINKPFDSKTYELLIDTYMNRVFSRPIENKILYYVIKIYQKRGEQAKQLPPTTEGTRCWKGYKKKGMKTMFGKRVPNCVKNEGELNEVSDADAELIIQQIIDSHGPKYLEQEFRKFFPMLSDQEVQRFLQKYRKQQLRLVKNEDMSQPNFDFELGRFKSAIARGVIDASKLNESVHPDKMTGNQMLSLLNQKHAWDEGMHAVELIQDVKSHNWALIDNYPLDKLGSVPDQYNRVLDTDDDYAMRDTDLSEPIVIASDRKTVIDGNHRVHKAREMGKTSLPAYFPMNIDENFADGKKKGKSRPGRVKRAGASCKGSVSDLRAKAKKYSGERGKMYHWCANMKGGKKKK